MKKFKKRIVFDASMILANAFILLRYGMNKWACIAIVLYAASLFFEVIE